MTHREAIQRLLTLIETSAPSFESPPELAARQFGAAGLMRCCYLLRGVCLLEDAGLGSAAGILERQHWEAWLLSLHALLRGEEALDEIRGDDIYWKRLLSQKLNLGLPYQSEWRGKIAKLNVKKLADDIEPLLLKAGESKPPATGYDVTFRVQSLFAVHAGLSTIGAHVRPGESTWGVISRPPSPFPRAWQTPALHTLHLARYVFKEFGLPFDELELLWDPLLHAEPDGDPQVM